MAYNKSTDQKIFKRKAPMNSPHISKSNNDIFYDDHQNNDYPVNIYYIDLAQMVMGDVQIHWHDQIEIDYIKMGNAVFKIGQTDIPLHEGEAVLINGGRIHSIHSAGSDECIILSVLISPDFIFDKKDSFLSLKYRNLGDNDSYMLYHKFPANDTSNINLINNILKANLEKTFGYELTTKGNICQLWLNLIYSNGNDKYKANSQQIFDEERTKKAIAYIHRNYMKDISLEELSESIHLSKSECCRSFKRATQMTPFEYLLRQRIFESAVKMQKNDPISNSINRLSIAVGFNNASYYNKIFKKYIGQTPSKSKEMLKRSHRDSLSPFGIPI